MGVPCHWGDDACPHLMRHGGWVRIINQGGCICELRDVFSHPGEEYLQPLTNCEMPSLVIVVDMKSDNVVSCEVKYKGWFNQYIDFPGVREQMKPAVRVFHNTPWRPLHVTVAFCCFWVFGLLSIGRHARNSWLRGGKW